MVGGGQFLFLCLFGLLCARANAAEPAPPSDPNIPEVTWPEIVRLVDAHPRVAASTARIAAARGGVKTAGAVPNPTLD